MELLSANADATFALGRSLGLVLQSGDFVGLTGQLGAGKTLFSRGVAEGAGVPLDDVSSPTYSIIQSYRGRLALHHVDLYRLTSEEELFSTGFHDLLEGEGAFLVEWIDQVRGAAPEDILRLTLEVTSLETRTFKVTTSGPKSEALLQRWTAERTRSPPR
ncbi:MAG: tRNA (adenosine(37)-N6)-threonylcarbamoyltransferase complex ATPase subunit type 1 TsaE [Archangium sp.]|nr:tRNA (adenosine(37)-N6)-threonylcarbamoyltransferase complex ATPase subunit type 1 TsaE [Archangium sp.]